MAEIVAETDEWLETICYHKAMYQSKSEMSNKRGFTVIELLFVIAIVGVMATMFLHLYQLRTENLRISREALQVEQILQAAETFYEVNYKWPKPSAESDCFTKERKDPFCSYLPPQIQIDPWGNNYSWEISADKHFFTVRTAPFSKASFATRLVSRLPNAEYDTASKTVAARIVIPGQILKPRKETTFGGMGYASNGQKVDNFSCPPGTTPKFSMMPSYINTYGHFFFFGIPYNDFGDIYDLGSKAVLSKNNKSAIISIWSNLILHPLWCPLSIPQCFGHYDSSRNAEVFYMVACHPKQPL